MSEPVLLVFVASLGWVIEIYRNSILQAKIKKHIEYILSLEKQNSQLEKDIARLEEMNENQKSQIELNNKEIEELLNIHHLSDFSTNLKKSKTSMN